jgi:serine phosphatase RsbU (regulator of sigma subunit)
MLLNEIFHVKKLYQPDEVLAELNRLVMLTLHQTKGSLSKDGMDMAFCNWDRATNRLLYAGANRPLYILRKGEKLHELKATKQSIGGNIGELKSYELHEIQLEVGDTVILTTDGFADQFGGENEKKFTTKLFKSTLEELGESDVKDQIRKLENKFTDWQGSYTQTDDVLVFIFKN